MTRLDVNPLSGDPMAEQPMCEWCEELKQRLERETPIGRALILREMTPDEYDLITLYLRETR